jgi:capsular polysaccharide biosynthesis protein
MSAVRVHESLRRRGWLSRRGSVKVEAAGLRLREFDPGQAAPWGAGGPVEAVDLETTDGSRAPARLFRLAPAQIETRMWVAFDPGVGYLGQTLRRKRRKTEKAGYRFHASGELTIPSRSRMKCDFPAIAIGMPYGQNYCHWWFDAVGWYLAIRRFVPDDARIVLNSNLAAFQREALSIAGIAAASVYELPPDHIASFPVLYVPASGRQVQRVVVDALRTLIPPTAKPHRRLYVSRQGGSARRVLNHDRFSAILEAHGFEAVVAETLSVRQQIELFAEAEVVLGVHGAGLTNAVFSPSGALLIELQPTSGFSTVRAARYHNRASLAGLRHLRIPCQPADEDWKADVYVDCERLDADLTEHLPHRQAAAAGRGTYR